jgi:hypothetical protein
LLFTMTLSRKFFVRTSSDNNQSSIVNRQSL